MQYIPQFPVTAQFGLMAVIPALSPREDLAAVQKWSAALSKHPNVLSILYNSMPQAAWDEIEKLYGNPAVDPATIQLFQELKTSQITHAKKEGNLKHYCSFFLPYDKKLGKIYLGHHIKADDWISPGGHIEPGEKPSDAAIREMKEELGVDIKYSNLEIFDLSVKPIGRPEQGCTAHYDVWFLVHIPVQAFDYLKSEYYDAGWFGIKEGIAKIAKNPDYAQIIAKLLPR